MTHKSERILAQAAPSPRRFMRRLAVLSVAALIALPASSALAQGVQPSGKPPPSAGGPSGNRQEQQPPPPPEKKSSEESSKGKGKGKGSAGESGKGKGKRQGQAPE